MVGQTIEMLFWPATNCIPGSCDQCSRRVNGSKQDSNDQMLANTNQCKRSVQLPRFGRVLSEICKAFWHHFSPIVQSSEEIPPIHLDRGHIEGFLSAATEIAFRSNVATLGLFQAIRGQHICMRLRHGCSSTARWSSNCVYEQAVGDE